MACGEVGSMKWQGGVGALKVVVQPTSLGMIAGTRPCKISCCNMGLDMHALHCRDVYAASDFWLPAGTGMVGAGAAGSVRDGALTALICSPELAGD